MTGKVLAGAAVVDITPPAGLAMSGFAARLAPASGTHDPLTVRALTIDETAVVVVDVVGLDEETCRRIRERCPLDADHVVVAALHTHGGPRIMPGRLGDAVDRAYLEGLEAACVDAVARALESRRPARLSFGLGADPGIAKNRRRPDGPTDPALPVLRVTAVDGGPIAILVSYACHPVVLGPDNTLWTADYPGFVRAALEEAEPGTVALFLTGCTADANTGHSAADSLRTAPNAQRTFAAAQGYANRIVEAVGRAAMSPVPAGVTAATAAVSLAFERREVRPPGELADLWQAQAALADATRAVLLNEWVNWARTVALEPLEPWTGRVCVLTWGDVRLVALPGEIFAETALAIRKTLDGRELGGRTIVFCFADGCPGYIPPRSEFAHGGYEVDEAHRYYGMPATFAPGSAELLGEKAVAVAAAAPRVVPGPR